MPFSLRGSTGIFIPTGLVLIIALCRLRNEKWSNAKPYQSNSNLYSTYIEIGIGQTYRTYYFVCSLSGMDTIRVVYEAPLFVFQACVYVHTSWTLQVQRESREKRLSLSPRPTSRGSTLHRGGVLHIHEEKNARLLTFISALLYAVFSTHRVSGARAECGEAESGVLG